MDINVKVRLESPELMASLLALAEALPQMNLGTDGQKNLGQALKLNSAATKEQAENKESAKENIKKETQEKHPTIEQIRALMTEKNKEGHTEEIKAIIKKHGANRLTEIDPKEYLQVMKEVEEISN